MRWLDGIMDSVDMSLSQLWEILKDKETWCAAAHRVRRLNNTRKHIQGSWSNCLSFQSNVWIPLTRTTKRNKGTHTALVWSSFWVWGSTFPMLGSLVSWSRLSDTSASSPELGSISVSALPAVLSLSYSP